MPLKKFAQMVDTIVMPSEENLVSSETLDAAVSGDPEAVARVWRAWNPRLLRFLQARRVADPDDLASVIWLDIATRLPIFEGDPAAFRRWLFTVAHRRIIDNARKLGRQVLTTPLDAAGQLASYDPVDDTAWALEQLAQLNEDQATAIALRFLADMSVAEVADLMERSQSNIRVITHRGLATLRERLTASLGLETQEDERNPENVVTLSVFRSLTPDA